MSVSQQYPDGSWRPAVPEPFWTGWRLRKARCECGQVFKSREAYVSHWEQTHQYPKKAS